MKLETKTGQKHYACWLFLGTLVICTASFAEQRPLEVKKQHVEIVPLLANSKGSSKRFGEHVVTQGFWVESDASVLNLSCVITNMQHDSAEKDTNHAPLVVNAEEGCQIEVPGAISSLGGAHRRSAALENNSRKRADGAIESAYITFQTVDGEAFQQEVYLSISWKQSTARQFSGKYKGAIKLVATIPNELEKIQ